MSKKQMARKKANKANIKNMTYNQYRSAFKGKLAKKCMPQHIRLQKSSEWARDYNGDNILKAYRKKFATDRLTTLKELQMLGFNFTKEEIEREYKAIKTRKQIVLNKKRKRKMLREERLRQKNNPNFDFSESDDNFFYIAGYTSGGAPYGVTYDEVEFEGYEDVDS